MATHHSFMSWSVHDMPNPPLAGTWYPRLLMVYLGPTGSILGASDYDIFGPTNQVSVGQCDSSNTHTFFMISAHCRLHPVQNGLTLTSTMAGGTSPLNAISPGHPSCSGTQAKGYTATIMCRPTLSRMHVHIISMSEPGNPSRVKVQCSLRNGVPGAHTPFDQRTWVSCTNSVSLS